MPNNPPSSRNWLADYLIESAEKRVCTKIGCTTCGAIEFRSGLFLDVGKAIGRIPKSLRNDREAAAAILAALSKTKISTFDQSFNDLEPAIRLIIFEIWKLVPMTVEEIERELVGSCGQQVLISMQAHNTSRMRAAQKHKCGQLLAQERKAAKILLRREALDARLVHKNERDRDRRKESLPSITHSLIKLALKKAGQDPEFNHRRGAGKGDHHTNSFMKSLNAEVGLKWPKKEVEIERAAANSSRMNFDFYIPSEGSVVEIALSARNIVTEVEKDIFKALIARAAGLTVNRLVILGKRGTVKRQTNPAARAIQKWVSDFHQLSIVIREFPGEP